MKNKIIVDAFDKIFMDGTHDSIPLTLAMLKSLEKFKEVYITALKIRIETLEKM